MSETANVPSTVIGFKFFQGMDMKFQKLEVWQLSYELSSSIYIATKDLRDWGFRDQITRSGLSVPSNIADKSAGATFERCDFLPRPRRGEVHGCTE